MVGPHHRDRNAVPFFSHDLGDGYALSLRDTAADAEVHAIVARNAARLREWEDWADEALTEDGVAAFTRRGLESFVAGTMLPCVLRSEGRAIGEVSLRIDPRAAGAELGFWIDAEHEGRGAVRRAAGAVVRHAFADLDVIRLQIRTAAGNRRSIRLAERLGFQHEGTLRAAEPFGHGRQDVAVYGLLASDPVPAG
jgi:ribosomal-protein-serine acetyltransferase